jgi:hypothetical protein
MILINRKILKSSLQHCRNIIKEDKLIKICKHHYRNSSVTNGNTTEIISLPSQRMKKYLLRIFLNRYNEEFILILFLEIFYANLTDFSNSKVKQLILQKDYKKLLIKRKCFKNKNKS